MASADVSAVLPDPQQILDVLRQDPWEALRQLHPVAAGILLVIGVAFLLYGFRIYKLLVIIAYAAVGIFLGALVAAALHFNPLIGMAGGAIILGLLAWPLYLVGWGLIGGAVLAALAAAVTQHFTPSPVYQGIAAAVAGILGIVLTILLMRTLIIIITSIVGAVALVEGALRLVLLVPSLGDPVMATLQAHVWLQAAVVVVPAVVGMILQTADKQGDVTGKAKSEGREKKESDSRK
jgi:hypothetical protein